jgi:hypothetical protein
MLRVQRNFRNGYSIDPIVPRDAERRFCPRGIAPRGDSQGEADGFDVHCLSATEWYEAERKNAMGTILLIVLILLLVGALPTWPYSSGWGYYPSGGLGLIVIVLLVLLLMGRL